MKYIAGPDCHPEKQTLLDYVSGSLSREETDAVSEHIASCVPCICALSEIALQHPSQAPAGFEEGIHRRIAREKEKKAEFFRFSFRVTVAACAAFFLISLGALFPAGSQRSLSEINPPDFSVVNSISSHLRDFSQKILNMEVFQNAETKK